VGRERRRLRETEGVPARALDRLDLAPAAVAFAAVAALGADDGGYFAPSWGWSAIGLSAAGGLALLLRSTIAIGRLELAALGVLAALAGWIALSAVWSDLPAESLGEAERALVYVAGIGAALLVAAHRSLVPLLAGVLAATTGVAAYALANRAISGRQRDPFQSNLLFEPIGYANALGILAAIGIILAAGLTLRAQTLPRRALGAGALAILTPALALTGSRGAWLALGAGLAAALAHERGRLAPFAGLLAVAAAGGFATIIARAADIPGDRPEYWRVAWQQVEANPELGSGAGTFQLYWLLYRPIESNVRDAHSLYLETLAELGPVGLALLLVALAIPLVAAVRTRAHPLVGAAAGAYVAFLVHAGLDWDWEMPAVTLAGLFCGSALLVTARPESAPAMTTQARAGAGALALVLAVAAAAGLVDNV
jgi:O-antigen ligase